MDDFKLDSLLTELGKEDHVPSDELILKTRRRIRRDGGVNLLIMASLVFNVLSIFILSYIIFFTSINIVLKICAYTAGSSIINVLILTVYFSRFKGLDFPYQLTNKAR